MEFLPFYNDLKIGGHFACAFIATMFSGVMLAFICLLRRDFRLLERSFVFALFASAFIWIVPMFCNVSAQIREFILYAFAMLSIVLIKITFNKSFKLSIILTLGFLLGQIVVFFLVYKKVFNEF